MRELGVAAGILALALGAVKVCNELAMTRMYERQAIALEEIASKISVSVRVTDSRKAVTVSLRDPGFFISQ